MLCALGCAGARAPSVARPEGAAGWDGPLVDLVPHDATLVVRARPSELIAAPASRGVIHSIVSDERLEAYRQHTGIDPRALEELVWAETPRGSILVVRGPFSAPLAVLEMAHRMLPLESSADEPFVRRVGHYQGARRDLVAVSEHVLLMLSGAPSFAQEIIGYAQRNEAGTVLVDATARELWATHAAAPVVVLAPQPLGVPRDTPVGLLLARERVLVASATPEEGAVALALDLRGEFPPGADENFRALFVALSESELGEALGMSEAVTTLTVHADAEHVAIRARVSAGALAAGLRVMFGEEIAELVDESGEDEAQGTAVRDAAAVGVRSP